MKKLFSKWHNYFKKHVTGGIYGVIFLFVFLCLAIIKYQIDQNHLENKPLCTRGVVLDVTGSPSGSYVEFSFRYNNHTYVNSTSPRGQGVDIGDTIIIKFSSVNPEYAIPMHVYGCWQKVKYDKTTPCECD